MMYNRVIMGLISAFFLVSISSTADAHRTPSVTTEVVVREDVDRKKVEVTHRFHAHDGIKLLGLAGTGSDPNLDNPKSLAQLALYTEQNFILSAAGQDIVLTVIGAEQDGGYVYIYQEGKLPKEQAIRLKSTILKSLGKDWSNTVHLIQDDKVTNFHFVGRGRAQIILP